MGKVKSRIYDQLLTRKRKYQKSPFSITEDILESQHWDRDKIEAWQIQKFNELLNNAKEKTEYYKLNQDQMLDEYSNVKSISAEFPKLTKELIISNSDSLTNPEEFNAFKHSTSGSTGKPISVLVSNLAESHRKARLVRFLNWWGADVYDKHVLIVGVNDSYNSKWGNFRNWMRNRKIINVLDLSDDSILSYFKLIEKYQPVYIRGYASAVLQLTKLMDKKNLTFSKSFLKVVIVTAEMLIEEDRAFMEKILKCKIANEYGAAEFGIIANECPDGSMHINEESILISTDDQDNAIITDLFNNKMPLLCYMNEDRLIISDSRCKCGIKLKVIDRIEGRANSFVQCPDGSEKNMYLLYKVITDAHKNGMKNSIQQFKVFQKNMKFVFEIIPNANFEETIGESIKDQMVREIGDGIEVEIRLVDTIKREKSGKLKFFEIQK